MQRFALHRATQQFVEGDSYSLHVSTLPSAFGGLQQVVQ